MCNGVLLFSLVQGLLSLLLLLPPVGEVGVGRASSRSEAAAADERELRRRGMSGAEELSEPRSL